MVIPMCSPMTAERRAFPRARRHKPRWCRRRASKGRRRLFRPGDPCDPGRATGKDVPRDDEIPPEYGELIDWYRNDYVPDGERQVTDPILSLFGLGKEIWADEDADAYVRRLREGW